MDALKLHFRLVLVDARGHGASDKPHDRASYVWPISVADILAVVDDLDIERAAFWGYSMGGAIVLGLAQHAPNRVSALIVGAATAYPRSLQTLSDGNNPEAFISGLETMIGARASPEYRSLLLSSDLRALAAAAQDRPSMLDGLPKMRMPCLIYAGESDGIFVNARTTAQQIPNAVFVSLPSLNHPAHAKKFLLGEDKIRAL